MWGFTVDDALISIRYARHLAAGLGWRFNVDGPSTDGVTPLPWPVLLAPFAGAEPLRVLAWAKTLGLVAWGFAGGALGLAAARPKGADPNENEGTARPKQADPNENEGTARPKQADPNNNDVAAWWGRAAALVTLALSVPVAAHAVSGMETALATALATLAATAWARPLAAASLAGMAASLRPEMAPWAVVIAVGFAVIARAGTRRSVLAVAAALGPFCACALLRAAVWGRPAPLAILAKPSDLDHGLAYGGAACVVTLVPLLVLAPLALRRAPVALAIVLAAATHVAAIVTVGGDWMPYARLMVPVVPSLAWAAMLVAEHAHPAATALRAVLALATGVWLLAQGGARGRQVGADRAALVVAARGPLAGRWRVASLDVGWVSAATEAHLVDLAGVTDPVIAALPGGHTSKRVDATLLLEQRPDALLLYVPRGLSGGLTSWREAAYSRALEARLAADDVVAAHFTPSAWLPLGADGAGYVLLVDVRTATGESSEPRQDY
jgi:hypothetical protein